MTVFRVWAPGASRVDLVLDGRRAPMRPAGEGWFEGEAEGLDYRFSLDGGDTLPDPRSPWQPEGVHGPSRVVDHGSFEWTDGSWTGMHLPSAILYELHVGTFTPQGTFDAAIGKLDHLVELGVSALEVMPVAEFAGSRGWGYDGVDLYAPHHAYGGPEGLKRFVDACHRRRLGVVLDVVYNHLGPDGAYLDRFGPYFTDRYVTPWGRALNLDGPDSGPVRDFICENALMWLRDYRVDGLRIDAVHAIVDSSAVHILEELAVRVEELAARLGRRLFLVAESDLGDPRLVRSREAGGFGLDAQWSDDFHHALHALLTGDRAGYYGDFGSTGDLAKALTSAYVYDGRYSRYRRRVHGRPPTGLPGHRFLGYLQNHDQVGNRAGGERTGHLTSLGRVKIGAALVLASPFVPMLFQGEEWAATAAFLYFTDHQPELGRKVTEGRRREFAAFGWPPEEVPDPQSPETFRRSVLDWGELARDPHAGVLDWYRRLIRMRRATADLTDGRLDRVQVRRDDGAGWLTVTRGSITLACNLSPEARQVPVPGAAGEVVLASEDGVFLDGGRVSLPPDSAAVLRSGRRSLRDNALALPNNR